MTSVEIARPNEVICIPSDYSKSFTKHTAQQEDTLAIILMNGIKSMKQKIIPPTQLPLIFLLCFKSMIPTFIRKEPRRGFHTLDSVMFYVLYIWKQLPRNWSSWAEKATEGCAQKTRGT